MALESATCSHSNILARENSPALDPQMAEALAQNAALQPKGVDRDALPIAEVRRIFEETRRFWNENSEPVAQVWQCRFETSRGPVAGRRYANGGDNNLPLVIYLHGGGWVLGSLESHDCVARVLCRHSGADVLSLDYALAPEHSHTGVIAQILEVASALETGDAGMVLCGDSAGGHLAVLAAAMAPPGVRQRLRGVASFYGVLSADMNTASFAQFGDGAYGLGKARMAFYWQQLRSRYRGAAGGEDPCRCDVSAFPPAWLVAAEFDVLCDATFQFAGHLRAHGRQVQVTAARGMGHAYLGYARLVGQAHRSASDFGDFLRSLV